MPKLGLLMTEGIVVKWLIADGLRVESAEVGGLLDGVAAGAHKADAVDGHVNLVGNEGNIRGAGIARRRPMRGQ